MRRAVGATLVGTGAAWEIGEPDPRTVVVRRLGAATKKSTHPVRNFPQTQKLASWIGRSARNC